MEKLNVFKRLAISDTGFIFDPQTGYSYVVNETGAEILNCLRKNTEGRFVLKHLMEVYDVLEDQARRDYDSFIMRLKQYGLYEEK